MRVQRQKLELTERRFSAVLASAEEMPWESDAEGRLTFAGDKLEEYFGYTQREREDLTLADLMHADEYARLAALVEARSGWTHERFRCVRKDGTEQWFQGSAIAHVGGNGKLLGLTGSCHRVTQDDTEDARLHSIRERVRTMLDRGQFHMVFQPIVSAVDGTLVGAEALARFDTPDKLPPDRWFSDARDVGLAAELELQAVAAALIAATELPDRVYVSINASPVTLAKPQLLQTLRSGPVPLDRVVIEVTEHVGVADYADLAHSVRHLRSAGVRIAVDDAGAGYSSFRHILSLAPEFIKLDRSLIQGLDEDPARRALTAAVVMFALEMKSTVIAEGIETPHEFNVAQSLGIDAAQGYLFGRPTDDWQQWQRWGAGWHMALRSAL
jgi:PAS domain S-box-containing protein